jgi:hypothetical protein
MLYNPDWKVETAVVTILRKAKDVIADPSHWTCGDYARDADGNSVFVDNRSAVSFCAIGALAFVTGTTPRLAGESQACKFLERVAAENGRIWAHDINDKGHSHAMAMIDRAIELASIA